MKVFLLSTNLLLLANVEDRRFARRNWPWKSRVEWLVKARCDLRYPLAAAGGSRSFLRPYGTVLPEELKCFADSQYLASICKTSYCYDLLEIHGLKRS